MMKKVIQINLFLSSGAANLAILVGILVVASVRQKTEERSSDLGHSALRFHSPRCVFIGYSDFKKY